MARCPQCQAEIDAMATVCSACGWDFPDEPAPPRREGWAYSRLADIALIVGMVAACLGSLSAILGTVFALLRGNLSEGLIAGPLCFFLCFGMFVVFARVQDMA